MAGKKVFKLPYAGVDKSGEYDLLVGQNGECSVVIKLTNPVTAYAAAPSAYDEFHSLMINIVKLLGDGYILQKQDIISRSKYRAKAAGEYLQIRYNEHFEGRDYLEVATYLTITRQVKKGSFYVFDPKALRDFRQSVGKVLDILQTAKTAPRVLKEDAINLLVIQILAMDFGKGPVALNNYAPGDNEIKMGGRSIRNISLVNIDNIDLPSQIGTHIEMNEKETLRGFPVDIFSFLFSVPDFDAILFNQVIEIPAQPMALRKLELKKKRHSGIPDPANLLCVEDIDLLLNDVARENQLLVTCHFNIIVAAANEQLQKASNFIESSLFSLGIIPSKNAYNQMELFRCALPGNGVEIKEYDWFQTTCDAAFCFFFKESMPKDEPSDFLVRFTDRQGVPIGIDPADLPMRTNRINNRNKFVLGPSGSGKSFFMNGLIEQYMLYNMDMVIVDTGHSYSGLCSYYNGKYITYTDKKPITMNPFQITKAEYNIEKKEFLSTLIGLLWKGADGTFNPVERDVISNVISAYYSAYFNHAEFSGISKKQKFRLRKQVLESIKVNQFKESDTDNSDWEEWANENLLPEISEADEALLEGLENLDKPGEPAQQIHPYQFIFQKEYRAALVKENKLARTKHEENRITKLNFNSFYEFAVRKIPEIKTDEQISFDIDEFRYVLKKFYKGGEFAPILNEPADQSLFTERFIVFEIDSIKENRVLFPIVTLNYGCLYPENAFQAGPA